MKNTVAGLYAQGHRPKAIAEELGIHPATVHRILRRAGIPPAYGSGNCERTPEEKARLRKMVADIRPDPEEQKGQRLSRATEFRAGHTPWNKGKPWPGMSGENHPAARDPEKYQQLGRALARRAALQPRMIGARHPNWQGGRTALVMKIRNSPQYATWRTEVFESDGYRCFICADDSGGNLNAHHIKALSTILRDHRVRTFEAALRTPQTWDVTNGVTLCESCHPMADTISRIAAAISFPRSD